MDALAAFGVHPRSIFADKSSGRDFDRPAYAQLIQVLRRGDVLVIKSIDRLGRNYEETIAQWRTLTKDLAVDVVVLDMPLLDTRSRDCGLTGTFIADIVLQLLSYVAEMERDGIRTRQAEGIAAAKARGTKFGRPRIQRPETYEVIVDACRKGGLTKKLAAERLGVSRTTLDRWLREDADAAESMAEGNVSKPKNAGK